MDKNGIESICRRVGLTPEKRMRVGDSDLFIADGRSSPPHSYYRRFGVGPDDFPGGCYVTLWVLAKDEKLDTGQPLFFELFHNPEYSGGVKKMARINTAIKEAVGFIARRKEAHARAN